MNPKIRTFLWFDTQAEEAMHFYTSIFANSRIESIQRYPDGPLEGPWKGMEGKVITGVFELAGQQFMALDGGPMFKFTPSLSLFVNCETIQEIDSIWEQLSEGGSALMPLQKYQFSEKFGWLNDRYGLSWQLNLAARAQKITPFLMFVGTHNGKAEDAMKFYTSLFQDSGIERIERYGEGEMGTVGAVKHAVFRLHGQEFMAMDGGTAHAFTFTEATSLLVSCQSQAEVDHFWDQLSADPQAEQCGWLKDRYGLSWQINPDALSALLNHPDPEKSKRVTDAMLQMKKIDIAGLERAANG
ncbi:MAG: VOC family protein [Anaerolineaceae bacterium]|nr:VOC family protein [Anaerolineaceae bacterium]